MKLGVWKEAVVRTASRVQSTEDQWYEVRLSTSQRALSLTPRTPLLYTLRPSASQGHV